MERLDSSLLDFHIHFFFILLSFSHQPCGVLYSYWWWHVWQAVSTLIEREAWERAVEGDMQRKGATISCYSVCRGQTWALHWITQDCSTEPNSTSLTLQFWENQAVDLTFQDFWNRTIHSMWQIWDYKEIPKLSCYLERVRAPRTHLSEAELRLCDFPLQLVFVMMSEICAQWEF